MKRFTKLFLFIFISLIAFTLVSCGDNKKDDNKGNNNGKEPLDEFWDANQNGVYDWQEEKITLTYASWQYNNAEVETIESLMVKEFTKKYPNITVEMQIVGEDAEWDSNMLSLLEADNLPDVFLVQRLENFLPLGMLADITEMYNHDSDTSAIFDSIKNLGVYNGKRYILPTYIYPTFWVVNLDLLEQYNVTKPSYDWTWDQMEQIAKSCYDPTQNIWGIYGSSTYYNEYPKVVENKTNAKNGWYAMGYDGENFNFMSDSFLQAMNHLEQAWTEGYVKDSLNADDIYELYGQDGTNWDPRYNGKVAIWNEASWSLKEHLDDISFDFDIYPAPSGVGMGNTDVIAVSSLCDHKQAAYQLLKWMSYSEEGIIRRYELYNEYKDELFMSGNNYPYPVADYGIDANGANKIWDNIPYGTTAPGLVTYQFTEALRNAAIKTNKEVIGWDAADTQFQTYFGQVIMGENTFAALQKTISDAAEKALKQKRDEIDNAIKDYL